MIRRFVAGTDTETSITKENIGQDVILDGIGPGILRFFGPTSFGKHAGDWLGIELLEAKGKNTGTVNNVQYFSCPPDHGVFVSLRSRKARLRTDIGSVSSKK